MCLTACKPKHAVNTQGALISIAEQLERSFEDDHSILQGSQWHSVASRAHLCVLHTCCRCHCVGNICELNAGLGSPEGQGTKHDQVGHTCGRTIQGAAACSCAAKQRALHCHKSVIHISGHRSGIC